MVVLAATENRQLASSACTIKNFLAGDIVDFSCADNVTGFSEPIVPNIVHYIKFRSKQLSFVELISILSVHENHRPDKILIHCSTCVNGALEGKYWNMLMKASRPPVEVLHFQEPTTIYGKNLSSVYHASDVARIRILIEHGGIFVDSDVYVVRSLERFRHFEMALGWPEGENIGTQVLVAHKNARFLKLWLESYQWYKPFLWYYNAGELPTISILVEKPELIHRVPILFGVHNLVNELYKISWSEWRTFYAIHLLIRHRDYLDKESPIKEFNEENIKNYTFTFGEMARMVLYGQDEPFN